CSCLASNTPVETSNNVWKPIGDVKVGETVLALGKDGAWKRSKVVYSDGTSMPQQPIPYTIYITTENDITLIVTPEHLFLMPDGEFKRADRLTRSDRLLDKNQRELKITTLASGSYLGPLHQIAATEWKETSLVKDGHLINTSGVISGDYFAELLLQPKSSKDLPQIGTEEYYSVNKLTEDLGIRGLKDTIHLTEKFKSIPSKRLVIPEDAVYFIPPGLDTLKENTIKSLNDPVPFEMALYLKDHFNTYYPDMVIQIDWNNPLANAIAYKRGGRQYVALFGGLFRNPYMKIEGVSLALAHEIGHHLGDEPRMSNHPWASCEGQADYWGALVGMRKVWFGHSAIENIKKGSIQFYNLMAYGLKKNLFELDMVALNKEGINAGCTHPPATCRLETYRAAMKADPKPACAD
ncbi:MAG: hypothetical protein ABJQ84_03445, partial [Ekhidna sp.]|uniref:hypothetical protein n=1 Tax=Ekhidna sp. TaxID=2608089 RepID=UPI003297F009